MIVNLAAVELLLQMLVLMRTTAYYVDCSSHSDSDSDRARLSSPKPKKAKKLQGAATYKTSFRSAWTKMYPFISSVHGDPFRLAEIVRHSGLYCGYIL